MRCPKCGNTLIYEDLLDESYAEEVHYEKWRVFCPSQDCNFEGKLWQNYRLESEEWAED